MGVLCQCANSWLKPKLSKLHNVVCLRSMEPLEEIDLINVAFEQTSSQHLASPSPKSVKYVTTNGEVFTDFFP